MQVTHEHTETILKFVYRGLRAHFEDGKPLGDVFPLDYKCLGALARPMQKPLNEAIAADADLLDAVHRVECAVSCPAFYECARPVCDGLVWCDDYNLGGSHGRSAGGDNIRRNMTRNEHKDAILMRQSPRRAGR